MRSGGSDGAGDREAVAGEADGRREGEGAAAREGAAGGSAGVGAATLPCARLTARQAIAAVADT